MNEKGFTLIETIISLAIITSLLLSLGIEVTNSIHTFNDARRFNDATDSAFENAQNISYTQNKSVYSNYQITGNVYQDNNKVGELSESDSTYSPIPVGVTKYKHPKNSNVYRPRFNSLDSLIGNYFKFSSIDGKSGRIEDLSNVGINKFEDLPDASNSALKNDNRTWGKWSFVGWSLGTYTSEDAYGTKNGDPKAAEFSSYSNGKTTVWQCTFSGLITSSNFDQFMSWYQYKKSINANFQPTLYPAYIFSRDISGNDNEVKYRMRAGADFLTKVDTDNIEKVASEAAAIIKNQGISAVEKQFTLTAWNALTNGKGLEILHSRQVGWCVLANTQYYSYGDSSSIGIERDLDWWGSDYSRNEAYKKFAKIGNNDSFTGGVKDGFLYHTFYDSIGYDLNEINDKQEYLSINYGNSGENPVGYNCLFMSSDLKAEQDDQIYSVFMKISNNQVTVTYGKIDSNGNVIPFKQGYQATAAIG